MSYHGINKFILIIVKIRLYEACKVVDIVVSKKKIKKLIIHLCHIFNVINTHPIRMYLLTYYYVLMMIRQQLG